MQNPTNLLEALEALRQLGLVLRQALADDGTLTVKDLPKLISLWSPVKAALDDANKIAGEITALNAEAAAAIVNKVVEVVDAWMSVLAVVK